MHGKVQLKNNTDHSAAPVSVTEEFHSQFMLNFNEYRDNNNYIYYNNVRTVDSRWLSLADKTYEFIDFDAKPVWIGTPRIPK